MASRVLRESVSWDEDDTDAAGDEAMTVDDVRQSTLQRSLNDDSAVRPLDDGTDDNADTDDQGTDVRSHYFL